MNTSGQKMMKKQSDSFIASTMKKFSKQKIPFITALAGVGLMILTLVWRINPAEGSIMPQFLTGNPVGVVVIYILLVTCMPVWISVVFFMRLSSFSRHVPPGVVFAFMIILQYGVYFLIGKLISYCVQKFSRKEKTGNKRGKAKR
jgi:hypothetical protein